MAVGLWWSMSIQPEGLWHSCSNCRARRSPIWRERPLDLAPVAGLDLQPLLRNAAPGRRVAASGCFDGGADELVEQQQRVVQTDLGHVGERGT